MRSLHSTGLIVAVRKRLSGSFGPDFIAKRLEIQKRLSRSLTDFLAEGRVEMLFEKRICRVPPGSSAGGQFTSCGTGAGGAESLSYGPPVGGGGIWVHPPMPTGTAGPLKAYVKAMTQLKGAIGAGDVAAIQAIKGPWSGHNYGKKFEFYRQEALKYVGGGGRMVLDGGTGTGGGTPAPRPRPTPPSPAPTPAPQPAPSPSPSPGHSPGTAPAPLAPRGPYAPGVARTNVGDGARAPHLGPSQFDVTRVVHGSTSQEQAYRRGLEFAAQVHGLPSHALPRSPLTAGNQRGSAWGSIQFKLATAMSSDSPRPYRRPVLEANSFHLRAILPSDQREINTTLHEFGHYLDVHGMKDRPVHREYSLGPSGGRRTKEGYASEQPSTPAMKELMGAIRKSETYGDIVKNWKLSPKGPEKKFQNYLKSPKECFARAYAQWVMEKHISTQRTFRAHLDDSRAKYNGQWSERDFKPISRAFDKLAKEQGWI